MRELPPTQVGAEEARDVADQVLSGRAYTEAAKPPSLQERFFDWIAEQIADFFSAVSTTGGRGAFAWVIILGFAGLIVFLVVRLLRNLDPLPRRETSSKPHIEVLGDRSADEWLTAAAEAEAGRDFRLGIRCRHRALATRLLDAGLIVARPGLTAGEIEQMVVAARPSVGEPMRQATWMFKDTWYGWIDADEAARDDFVRLSDEVMRGIASTSEQDRRDLAAPVGNP